MTPYRPRFSIARLFVWIAVAGLLLAVGTMAVRLYFHERLAVESYIRQFANSCDFAISESHEAWCNVRGTTITLKDRPHDQIVVTNLENYATDGSHLYLTYVNGLGLLAYEVFPDGSTRTLQPSVDIGKRGEFADRFPFKINSVGDLINNYEELLATVEAWPKTRESAEQFETMSGRTIGYYSTPRK